MNLLTFICLYLAVLVSCVKLSEALEIVTKSCLAGNDSFVRNGTKCFFTCEVSGLKPNQYFSIEKTYFRNLGLTADMELNRTFTIFAGTYNGGLHEKLLKTGRYSSTIHSRGHAVTVWLKPVVSGDSGTYVCTVRNLGGTIVAVSEETVIAVLGVTVIPRFGKVTHNRSLKVEELYQSGWEVDVTYEDLNNLAFVVNVTGTMPVRPKIDIRMEYPDLAGSQDITYLFQKSWTARVNDFNYETGIMNFTSIQEILSQPGSTFFTPGHGKPTLVGTYSYGNFKSSASVVLNFIFSPTNLECPSSPPVLEERDFIFTCHLESNPAPTFFTLTTLEDDEPQIPARQLQYSLQKSPQSEWSYILKTTYHDYPNGLRGPFVMFVKNNLGNASLVFVVKGTSDESGSDTEQSKTDEPENTRSDPHETPKSNSDQARYEVRESNAFSSQMEREAQQQENDEGFDQKGPKQKNKADSPSSDGQSSILETIATARKRSKIKQQDEVTNENEDFDEDNSESDENYPS